MMMVTGVIPGVSPHTSVRRFATYPTFELCDAEKKRQLSFEQARTESARKAGINMVIEWECEVEPSVPGYDSPK